MSDEDNNPEYAGSKLARVTAAMAAVMPTLERCVAKVAKILDEDVDDYDVNLASHLFWSTERLSGISAELRQLEKHDRVMTRTPEQRWELVRDYVRNELSPRQRTELAAMLEQLQNARVVA